MTEGRPLYLIVGSNALDASREQRPSHASLAVASTLEEVEAAAAMLPERDP